MRSLPLFLRIEGRRVILIGEGAMGDAKRRLLARAGAVIVDEAADARIAFVALADPDAAAARLRARGLLIKELAIAKGVGEDKIVTEIDAIFAPAAA